jgi:predicted Zn-dependent protease
VLWELAQAASELGQPRQAIAALEALVQLQPAVSSGWFLLGGQLRKEGREQDAWRADLSGVHASSRDPELLKAAVAMNEGKLDEAEAMLKARLARWAEDPAASRLLGEVLWRRGDLSDALDLVQRAVDLAPGFDLARDFLVRLLLQSNRLTEALTHAESWCNRP